MLQKRLEGEYPVEQATIFFLFEIIIHLTWLTGLSIL